MKKILSISLFLFGCMHFIGGSEGDKKRLRAQGPQMDRNFVKNKSHKPSSGVVFLFDRPARTITPEESAELLVRIQELFPLQLPFLNKLEASLFARR